MRWLESFLMIGGISLDVFAAMACQGALVAKIEKKHFTAVCCLTAFCQAAALLAGSLCAAGVKKRAGSHEQVLGGAVAAAIVLCLGVRLLIKAWRNEQIVEKRAEHLKWQPFLSQNAADSLYMLLIGAALGLLGIPTWKAMALAAILSLLGAALGIYTGYRLGFEQKIKAYTAGAALLVLSGIEVLVQSFAN